MTELLAALRVCPLDYVTLKQALSLPFTDDEDALQCACAVSGKLEAIVTQNPKDYSEASLPVYDPEHLLQHLGLVNS